MNNAVFVKTMQNVGKHRTVKLIKSWYDDYEAKHLNAIFTADLYLVRTLWQTNLHSIHFRYFQGLSLWFSL